MLHNLIAVAVEGKMSYAERYDEEYHGNEKAFVAPISNEEFAVKGNYGETWSFIR